MRNKNSSKSARLRKLILESLEARRLMAGDLSDDLWTAVATLPAPKAGQVSYHRALQFKNYTLDSQELGSRLANAPAESQLFNSDVLITLPKPNGQFESFQIVSSPIMAPGLAARFQNIQTFAGQGIENPASKLRFDLTPNGFHAQVLSPDGSYYIDPYYHLDASIYSSYYAAGEFLPVKRQTFEDSDVVDNDSQQRQPGDDANGNGNTSNGGGNNANPPLSRSGEELRVYRAAVAANGEYTQFHGGTVEKGLAAVVTAMNRVTGIYESELSIRMELIENNDRLVYTDPNSDPYTNNNPGQLLQENQANIDALIGDANYDIGHVFTTGGGGVAGLGVVGITGQKARGETGLDEPIGDAYWVDFVAHEIGHQFGGNHSFNGISGNCGARNASTAYEPGSGVTIQAYAGICAGDDIAQHSDPNFHSVSFDEILRHVDQAIPTVGTRVQTNNAVPEVDAGPVFTIPTGTPFEMTAVGTDTDAGQVLTYDWQQRDLGPAQNLTDADNGTSPLFRTWPPTTSPSRSFPRLNELVTGQLALGEKIPTVARTMKLRVLVRDNRLNGAGSSSDDTEVKIVDTGAPFKVTSPNTNVSWEGFSKQTITWDVAGTTSNGIDTANVDILLSVDGGLTYPRKIATATPNDGTQEVTIPNAPGTKNRIRVQGSGNIFFDISDVDFSITPSPIAIDYGDAPNTYGTNSASNGAQHNTSLLTLGALVDVEEDGQPTPDATGDGDDEDGVKFLEPLVRGQTSNIEVTASEAGILNFFIDFDGSGTFANQPNEAFTRSVSAGTQNIPVTIPSGTGITTFARFRISKLGISSPVGVAPDGEVEDYQISISAPPPTLAIDASTLNYIENGQPLSVASSMTVTDPFRSAYPNTKLTVRFTSGATSADRLSILSSGNGAGQISANATEVRYGNVVIGQITSLAPTVQIDLNADCSLDALQALLRAIAYSNSSDAPLVAARTVEFALSSTFGLVSVTRDVQVTPVNDSPTLAIGTLVGEEDSLQPQGKSISILLESGFNDPDAGSSMVGIAVVSNPQNALEGVWYYSSNFGAAWSPIGNVDDANASLVLRKTDWIGFKPATDFFGQATPLEVRGLDNTYTGNFSNSVQNRRENLAANQRQPNGPTSANKSPLRGSITGINDAPRPLQAEYLAEGTQDAPFDLILPGSLFVDIDSPSFTWSLQSPEGLIPSWINFNPSTRRITGTPRNEDVGVLPLTIVARDNEGAEGKLPFFLTVLNVNDAPISVRLLNTSVLENRPGAKVGKLEVLDPDVGDTFTWTVSDPRFEVIGNELFVTQSSLVDFETETFVDLQVKVADSGTPSLTLEVPIQVSIVDENEFFPDLKSQIFTVPHGTNSSTLLAKLSAPDGDSAQSVRLRLKSGDISSFQLNEVTGDLRFVDGISADRTQKSEYVIIVEAADNGLPSKTRSAQLRFQVQRLNSIAPSIPSQTLSVGERAKANFAIGTIAANDGDGDLIASYEITDAGLASLFFVEPTTGVLRLRQEGSLDFETQKSYLLPIRVTDKGLPSRTGTGFVTVAVTDQNDPPTGISLSVNGLPTLRAGFELGSIKVVDPDQLGSYSYSTTDPRFEFKNGKLTLKASQFMPSAQAGTSFQISVRVADATDDSNFSILPLTIQVSPDASPWQNTRAPLDINRDGSISPLDALQLINYLNLEGTSKLSSPRSAVEGLLSDFDVNGDGFASPLDALTITNFLNLNGTVVVNGEGEGEANQTLAPLAETKSTLGNQVWLSAFQQWEGERLDGAADDQIGGTRRRTRRW